MLELAIKLALCISHSMAWISGGLLIEATRVDQDHVLITLPVFITSVIATAVFTWTIAQWDVRRTRRVDVIERKLDLLAKELKRS